MKAIYPDAVKLVPIVSAQAVAQSPSFRLDERQIVGHRLSVVTVDPFRTRLGWPVEIPRVDSRTRTLASANGFMLEQRPEPSEVSTGAIARWIADADTYDEVTGVWRPSDGELNAYSWISSGQYKPELIEEMTYFVGRELFTRGALNFDATLQQHLWSQFSGGITGVAGYTVLMAVILNSTYGDTEGRAFSGLWSPGGTPLDDETWDEPEQGFSVMLEEGKLVVTSEETTTNDGLRITEHLASSRPVYIGFSLGYPVSSVWASLGVGRTTTFATNVGEEVFDQQLNVALGRSAGSLLNTADMSVFDIGIYPDVLTFSEVEQEIALLASTYGG